MKVMNLGGLEGAWAGGGNFWQGTATGLLNAGLNHGQHALSKAWYNKRFSRIAQNLFDKIREVNLSGGNSVDLRDIGFDKLLKFSRRNGKWGYSEKQFYVTDENGNNINVSGMSMSFLSNAELNLSSFAYTTQNGVGDDLMKILKFHATTPGPNTRPSLTISTYADQHQVLYNYLGIGVMY